MEIQQSALAGTLESSDAQVTVSPDQTELTITIQSPVLNQYGRQIRRVVLATLKTLGVTTGRIQIVDKGALDCTIKARVEGAIYRSGGKSESEIDWEALRG